MGAHLEGNGEDVEDEGGHKEGVEYNNLTAGHNSGYLQAKIHSSANILQDPQDKIM
jgi:hypothetical protein